MNLLLFGETKVLEDEEIAKKMARSSLLSLAPKLVLVDVLDGWGLISAQEAYQLALPMMAVLPYSEIIGNRAYEFERNSLLSRVKNRVVFNETRVQFLKSPKSYVEWVSRHTDAALCYVDVTRSSVSHSLMLGLEKLGKRVHNLHRSQHD